MAVFKELRILSQQEVAAIHEASLALLERTGVRVPHEQVRGLFAEAGAAVDARRPSYEFRPTSSSGASPARASASLSQAAIGAPGPSSARESATTTRSSARRCGWTTAAGSAVFRAWPTLPPPRGSPTPSPRHDRGRDGGSSRDPGELSLRRGGGDAGTRHDEAHRPLVPRPPFGRLPARDLPGRGRHAGGARAAAASLSLSRADQPAVLRLRLPRPALRDLQGSAARADRADGPGRSDRARHAGRRPRAGKRRDTGRHLRHPAHQGRHAGLLRWDPPRLRHADDPADLRRPRAGADGGGHGPDGAQLRPAGLHQRGPHRQQAPRRPGGPRGGHDAAAPGRWRGPTSLAISASAASIKRALCRCC